MKMKKIKKLSEKILDLVVRYQILFIVIFIALLTICFVFWGIAIYKLIKGDYYFFDLPVVEFGKSWPYGQLNIVMLSAIVLIFVIIAYKTLNNMKKKNE